MTDTGGMSLSFDAIGLESIQQKIATTAKSFKSLDREAKKLSGLGRAIGRLGSMGSRAAGAAGAGPFAGIVAQLGSFAIMANLTKQTIRNFSSDFFGRKNITQLRRADILGRRIYRGISSKISKIRPSSLIPPEFRMLGRELMILPREIGKSLKKGFENFDKAQILRKVGRGARDLVGNSRFVGATAMMFGRDIGRGAVVMGRALRQAPKFIGASAAMIGRDIFRGGKFIAQESGKLAIGVATAVVGKKIVASAASLISSVAGGLLAGVAIAATFVVAAVAAYFKVDTAIGKAMKWVTKNVLAPIGVATSNFFTAWKDAFAQLTDRGEWLSKMYSPVQANRRFSVQERAAYEKQVKQDLENRDWEEGIETQINELRNLWKESDEKILRDSKRIVDQMYFQERI
jgi:hypothetical protein